MKKEMISRMRIVPVVMYVFKLFQPLLEGGLLFVRHSRPLIQFREYPTQIHTLILLSLGSLLPLSSYFPFSSPSQRKPLHIHIIDSHRPYNLQNLFGWAVNDGWVPGGDDYPIARGSGVGPSEIQGRGRIWVWGDGMEDKLQTVKKSWEAIEVRKNNLLPSGIGGVFPFFLLLFFSQR